jgi:hypothetical protein
VGAREIKFMSKIILAVGFAIFLVKAIKSFWFRSLNNEVGTETGEDHQ